MFYFLIFTLLTANYHLLGEKVSLIFLSLGGGGGEGGTIDSREKSYFFPTNVMCAVKVCAVPVNVEQNTKNNSL